MEQFIQYAPIIIVVLMFLLKSKFFVTPEQLTDKLSDCVMKKDYLLDRQESKAELNEVKGELKKALELLIAQSKDIEYIKKAIDQMPKRKGDE